LDASATATYNDDETALGAGANLVDGAATLGTKANNARFGLSAGIGAGARYHHALDPETHKRSYGIGFDGGPLSADIRTDVFSDVELGPTEEATMDSEAPLPRSTTVIQGYAEPAR
jgi:hypothetical protein